MYAQAVAAARTVTQRCIQQADGDLIDGRLLMKAALAGYLTGAGVPTDEAVAQVEQLTVPELVGPAPENPLFHGLPWAVPGPVSGAPYYADRPRKAWEVKWR